MKPIALLAPKISQLSPAEASQFNSATDLAGLEFADLDIAGQRLKAIGLDSCRLLNVVALATVFDTCQWLDCGLSGGDLTAARLDSNGFERVRFSKVRASGLDLAAATCKSVEFIGCKLDMANFRQATLHNVRFRDCELGKADFVGAKLHNVEFIGCAMVETEFGSGSYSNVDLRDSDIYDIKGAAGLKGVTISSTQLIGLAPHLAHELGILIED